MMRWSSWKPQRKNKNPSKRTGRDRSVRLHAEFIPIVIIIYASSYKFEKNNRNNWDYFLCIPSYIHFLSVA